MNKFFLISAAIAALSLTRCNNPSPQVPGEDDPPRVMEMTDREVASLVLEMETEALTNWSNADLVGYTFNFREDASYIDNIMAPDGIYGLDSIRTYMAGLEELELIGKHSFEIREPNVQVLGNTAIITLKHHAIESDGTPAPIWKASVVYENSEGGWKVVHANWSPYFCGE